LEISDFYKEIAQGLKPRTQNAKQSFARKTQGRGPAHKKLLCNFFANPYGFKETLGRKDRVLRKKCIAFLCVS
jgi:hypothetical protein